MAKKILLVTNGCEESWATIQHAAEMSALMGVPLTLLGVVEKADDEHPVEEIFGRAVSLFQEKNLVYDLQLVNGKTEDILSKITPDKDTYLFVGVLGRSQLRHWLVGRSFRQILENVEVPIFYARKAPKQIEKILICFGGLDYTKRAEEIGIEIGKMADAKLSLLHIIPPVEAEQLPKKALPENEKDLQATDAQAAQVLQEAQQHAQAAGVDSQIIIRNGNIVTQILAELERGKYDLVCLGSPFSDKGWRHLYLPNIAAEIAESSDAPLMIARSA